MQQLSKGYESTSKYGCNGNRRAAYTSVVQCDDKKYIGGTSFGSIIEWDSRMDPCNYTPCEYQIHASSGLRHNLLYNITFLTLCIFFTYIVTAIIPYGDTLLTSSIDGTVKQVDLVKNKHETLLESRSSFVSLDNVNNVILATTSSGVYLKYL